MKTEQGKNNMYIKKCKGNYEKNQGSRLTVLRWESERRGSSAANMPEEMRIQTRMTLLKRLWLQIQWQKTRNL